MKMKILIKDDKEIYFDGVVSKDTVVVGRGSSCDVRCLRDVVSRKHLQIKVEDQQIFIKRLSSKTWVLLDEKVLDSQTYVPYFEFSDLRLPGDITVRISIEQGAVEERNELRKPPKFVSMEQEPQEKSGFFKNIDWRKYGSRAILALSAVLAFALFRVFTDEPREVLGTQQRPAQTEVSIVKKPRISESENLLKESLEAALALEESVENSCIGAWESEFCQFVFGVRAQGEGIALQGDKGYAVVDLHQRQERLFGYKYYNERKNVEDNYIALALISHLFLDEGVVRKAMDRGVSKLFVRVVSRSRVKGEIRELGLFELTYGGGLPVRPNGFKKAVNDLILNDAGPFYYYLGHYVKKLR